jgi:hypothetical protein
MANSTAGRSQPQIETTFVVAVSENRTKEVIKVFGD